MREREREEEEENSHTLLLLLLLFIISVHRWSFRTHVIGFFFSYLILPCLTQHIKQKKKVFRFVSRFLLKKKIFFFSLFLHSTPFFRITYIFRYIIDRTRHIMSSKNDEMDVVFKQSEKTQSEATCRGTVRERNRSRRRK